MTAPIQPAALPAPEPVPSAEEIAAAEAGEREEPPPPADQLGMFG